MNTDEIALHICDDWISFDLTNRKLAISASRALSAGGSWQEIVVGLDSVAVQFDPALLSPDQASRLVSQQLKNAYNIKIQIAETIEIPVCYAEQYAPDLKQVAYKLGISQAAVEAWHSNLTFEVTMIGFMPGFAYLQCEEPVADIGRLDKPRQKVAAGSIGIIDNQSCIYSFESPGGWPIIGRTPVRLFDKNKPAPSLLSASQSIIFRSISEEDYLAQLVNN